MLFKKHVKAVFLLILLFLVFNSMLTGCSSENADDQQINNQPLSTSDNNDKSEEENVVFENPIKITETIKKDGLINAIDFFPIEEEKSYIMMARGTDEGDRYNWVNVKGKMNILGNTVYAVSNYYYDDKKDLEWYYMVKESLDIFDFYNLDEEGNLIRIGHGSLEKPEFINENKKTENTVLLSEMEIGKDYILKESTNEYFSSIIKLNCKGLVTIRLPNGEEYKNVLVVVKERNDIFEESKLSFVETYYYYKDIGLIAYTFVHSSELKGKTNLSYSVEYYLKDGVPSEYETLLATISNFRKLDVNVNTILEYFESRGCTVEKGSPNPNFETIININHHSNLIGGHIVLVENNVKSMRVHMPVFYKQETLPIHEHFFEALASIFDDNYVNDIYSWITSVKTVEQAYNKGYDEELKITSEVMNSFGEYELSALYTFYDDTYVTVSIGINANNINSKKVIEETDQELNTDIEEGAPNYVEWDLITASSTLKSDKYSYSPELVNDWNNETAWVEGKNDDGVGEWIKLESSVPIKIRELEILNGYQKSKDLFEKNGRVKTIRLEFSDSTSIEKELIGGYEYWDRIIFDQEIETKYIKITILDVYSGTEYKDTCISEIHAF